MLAATLTDKQGNVTAFAGAAETSTAAAGERLTNISTRLLAGTGAQVAIAGFVVAGEESKPVLIRAVGPTLAVFGVNGVLATPKLDIYSGSTVIATNTGWTTSGNSAEIAAAAVRSGAFALGATSADSAILTTLAPGSYTAMVSAANGSSGVVLVEVYDLSGVATGQKLINISTRGTAGNGENTMIAGVVVGGAAPKRLLIRAAGPALAQFGLPGTLARPQLVLYSGSTVVAQNSGWSSSPDATAIASSSAQVGAFAFAAGSLDSALLVNLAPGAYTAQVSGANGTTGLALIEIYEVP
jgi:hypothetical protein